MQFRHGQAHTTVRFGSTLAPRDGETNGAGWDIGRDVERLSPGDSDYEYAVTVGGRHAQKVLLELLKDFLPDEVKFRDWLTRKEISSEFWSF